ncbi:MAG: class I SAM-dependent methyltransferase [Bacillota bacterium]
MATTQELLELERFMIRRGGWTYLRLIYLLDSLQQIPLPRNVLSYGCGMGFHEYYLARAFPSVQIDALDIDSRAIGYACRHYHAPNLRFILGDYQQVRQAYDLVFSIEVLEHIPEPWPVLTAMCRHANYLFLLVPQWHNTTPEQKEHLRRALGHQHVGFTRQEICKHLRANGFRMLKHSNCYWEDRGGLARRLLEKVGTPDTETTDIFRRLFRLDLREGSIPSRDGRGLAQGLKVLACKT